MSSTHGSESDEDPLLFEASIHRPNKRRRIESSPVKEVIETSDDDEREQLAAQQPSYWTTYAASRTSSALIGPPHKAPGKANAAFGPVMGNVTHAAPRSPRRRRPGLPELECGYERPGPSTNLSDVEITPKATTRQECQDTSLWPNIQQLPPPSLNTDTFTTKEVLQVVQDTRQATHTKHVSISPKSHHDQLSDQPHSPLLSFDPQVSPHASTSVRVTNLSSGIVGRLGAVPFAADENGGSSRNGESSSEGPPRSSLSPSQMARMDLLLRSTRSTSPPALSLPDLSHEMDALLEQERQPSLQLFTPDATPNRPRNAQFSLRRSSVGASDNASPTRGDASQQSSQRRAQSDPPAFSPLHNRTGAGTPSSAGRNSPPFIIPPDLDSPQGGRRRNLRNRTAIQINPYTREALMYKATLARAGAKEAFVRDIRNVVGAEDGRRRGSEVGMDVEEETQDWNGDADEDEESQSQQQRRRSIERGRPIRSSSVARRPIVARQPVPHQPSKQSAKQPPPGHPAVGQTPAAKTSRHKSKADMLKSVAEALGGLISDDEDDPIMEMLRKEGKTTPPVTSRKVPTTVYASKASTMRHRSPLPTSSNTSPLMPLGSASSVTAAVPVTSSFQSLDPPPFGSMSPSPPPRKHRRANLQKPEDDPIVIEDDSPPAKRRPQEARTQAVDDNDNDVEMDSRGSQSDASSDDDDDEDDNDDERALGESKRDKRLRKTVRRVFPAFMVKMMQADNQRQQKRQAHRTSSSDDEDDSPAPRNQQVSEDSDGDEGRERVGRIRIVPNPRGRLDIQGDPESSDHEHNGSKGVDGHEGNGPDEWDMRNWGNYGDDGVGVGPGGNEPPVWDDRIASSEESDTDERNADIVDFDVNSWLDRPSPAPREAAGRRPSAPHREGDLIDRMLTRHVNISSTRRKPRPAGTAIVKRRRGTKDQPTLREFQQQHPLKHRAQVGSSKTKEPGQRRQPKISVNVARGPVPSSSHQTHRHQTHSRRQAARGREQPLSITFRKLSPTAPLKRREPIEISDDDDDGYRMPDQEGLSNQPAPDFFDLLRPERNPLVTAPHSVSTNTNRVSNSNIAETRPQTRRQNPKSHDAEVRLHSYASALSRKGTRDSLIDFGLPSPPTASSFDRTTYLGSGRLVQLLLLLGSRAPGHRPDSTGPLDPSMALPDLEDCIPAMFDGIYEWRLRKPKQQRDENPSLQGTTVPGVMQFLCDYASWSTSVYALSNAQDVMRFTTIVQEQVQHLITRLQDPVTSTSSDLPQQDTGHVLKLHWFAVELSLRVWHSQSIASAAEDPTNVSLPLREAVGPTSSARRYLGGLVRLLLDTEFYDFRSPASEVGEAAVVNDLESTSAEVWICCVHLLEALDNKPDNMPNILGDHPLWRQILSILNQSSSDHAAGLEASEKLWRSILALNMLSRFSSQGIAATKPRLPACWGVVQHAVSLIRLESNPDKDAKTMAAVLQKRDAYIRLVLSRCLLLITRWEWNTCGADALLKSLTAIFRTRKFENLRGEVSDFPVFLRDLNDQAFLEAYDKRETSFGIFLKLVLHAAKDHRQDPRGVAFGQKQLRKLASLIFPIGTTPFTRDNPPVGRDLSMLFNRLAAVVAVVHLEPTNAKLRVQQARKFLDFKNAEANSRSACIRGMMLIAVVHRRQELEMTEIMAWYADMVGVLLQDLKEAEQVSSVVATAHPGNRRPEIAILVLQLVGALRKVIETMPPEGTAKYPNPIFLEQACLDQIMASSMSDDVRTSLEMRKLVQAFLEARANALGPRRTPDLAGIPQVEGESQQSDEYGDWGVNWDDPRLLIALGEGEKTADMMMEERVAEVVKSTLSPAIFRFIQKHFGDTNNLARRQEQQEYDDKWVECWVGCIDVLVRNNIKAWSQYQEWGDESLDRIVDPASRRGIEWRFLLAMLRVDPEAYLRNQDWSLRVWLTAIVTARLTRENEFTSVLLNSDKMRNSLLRDLPYVVDEDGRFSVTIEDVEEMRLPTLRAVTRNIIRLIRSPTQSTKDKQCIAVGVNGMLGALTEMKDSCERLTQLTGEGYISLCRGFVEYLKTPACDVLWDEPRISNAGNLCLMAVEERLHGDLAHD
ncbi:hypothetical protein FRB95_008343 [Tulasnella sp. JGI-2019a]|nr:hypothetical protein FRB95_008343 [Tulasnella sp. JGI-2019a]